jgi:hypothetical protein
MNTAVMLSLRDLTLFVAFKFLAGEIFLNNTVRTFSGYTL